MQEELAIDAPQIKEIANRSSFLTQLLYEKCNSWFPPKHVHLRNVKAHLPEVHSFLSTRKDRDMNYLWVILLSVNLYLNLPAFDEVLCKWYKKLGEKFVTFMSNFVVQCIQGDAFIENAEDWFLILGPKFISKIFGRGSFASRIQNREFQNRVSQHFIRLGREAHELYIVLRNCERNKRENFYDKSYAV
jgi:hypothetical protein